MCIEKLSGFRRVLKRAQSEYCTSSERTPQRAIRITETLAYGLRVTTQQITLGKTGPSLVALSDGRL
jgi:hypothetical protein